jgi:hypothetical protein
VAEATGITAADDMVMVTAVIVKAVAIIQTGIPDR